MYKILITSLYFSLVYCYNNESLTSTNKTFIYNIYSYRERIVLQVNSTTEQILDFVEASDEWRGYPTRVHVSTNSSLNVDYPLFITAEQQKGVSSWELPLIIRTDMWALIFNNMARTLCPHDAGPDVRNEKRPTIHISTTNPKNSSIDILVRRVTDFYIEMDKEVVVNITPSTPKYYYFSFNQIPPNDTDDSLKGLPIVNYIISKSVILIIESDDELCATVSIQNNTCPVFDNEQEVQYKGYFLTMTTKGGITLTQSMYPTGFYVVFIVRESDSACTGSTDGIHDIWQHGREKTIRFRIVPTISYMEYLISVLVSLALVALVPLFTLAVLVVFTCQCIERAVVPDDVGVIAGPIDNQPANDGPIASTSNTAVEEQPGPSRVPDVEDNQEIYESGDTENLLMNIQLPPENDVQNNEIEQSLFGEQALTVAMLSRVRGDILARRSSRYLWSTITVGIVYALPVVQLLLTYQGMVFQTGDQDLCYYNFLCAHPLGNLSDFNHVFSNIGYIIFGLVFMMQVLVRQRKTRGRPNHLGIPLHYGLLYAMGFALSMEGVLSGSYHFCPNKMNFQFDSSFMYLISILVILKLYHNRHSDIVPSAQSTFVVFVFVMAVGVYGIIWPSLWFAAVFTIFHLLACFFFTLKIYYTGKFTMELSVVKRAWLRIRSEGFKAFVPIYTARAVLLVLANVANWAFAISTAYEHNEDFARELLAILLGNAILYTIFYIAMKCIHKEKILPYTWLYMILSIVTMILGFHFFSDSRTKWSETPSQSRQRNAPCESLEFYDTHDLWHAASAAGMYFSFNMLLTIDDALADTDRLLIPTF